MCVCVVHCQLIVVYGAAMLLSNENRPMCAMCAIVCLGL
jgi:hypothetical protein